MSDLLPHTATPQERAVAESVARISAVPVPVRDIWNAETCPLNLLPWLAWAFSVDEWDAGWSEAQKRGAVQASVSVHRRKGTVGALKEALGALGHDLEVQEWHQLTPAGAPYTFGIQVTVDQEGIADPAAFDTIVAVANSAKNVRSHMWGVDILGVTRAGVFFAGATVCGEIVTISAETA